MPQIRFKPIFLSLVSALLFLFTAWPVLSRQTLPEFLGPALTPPAASWYYYFVIVVAVIVVGLLGWITYRVESAPKPATLEEFFQQIARQQETEERSAKAKQAESAPAKVPPPAVLPKGPRVLVTQITPLQITKLFERHADERARQQAAAYVGKWFRFEGPIHDVVRSRDFATLMSAKDAIVVKMFLDPAKPGLGQSPLAEFHFPVTADVDLSHLDKGHVVAIEGMLQRADRSTVKFEHCELANPVHGVWAP